MVKGQATDGLPFSLFETQRHWATGQGPQRFLEVSQMFCKPGVTVIFSAHVKPQRMPDRARPTALSKGCRWWGSLDCDNDNGCDFRQEVADG